MKNIEATVKGNKLTLVVDLKEDFGPSKSGLTTIIASSQGNADVPGKEDEGIKFGLNVYKKV